MIYDFFRYIMRLKPIYIFPICLALILAVSLLFVGRGEKKPQLDATENSTVSEETVDTTEESTESTEPAGPRSDRFTLTFVGDCTLGSGAANWDLESSFVRVVGDDYDYPFSNVAHIFESDDFTLANLEGPLTEGGTPMEKEFVFRGPTAYTAILRGVEAVTISNNHILDYGYQGQSDTKAALTAAGIAYGAREQTFLYTTESGLSVGVYCDDFAFDRTHIADSIAALREQGADIVVCAFHWGEEKDYTPNQNEIDWAHIAINAGADIVTGHHPHVLQPIEYYNGGVILYSLANFSFGGNDNPTDADTAIIQQEVIREPDGSVRLGELTIIPCSVSSVQGRNDYRPTPMEPGSEAYNRVLQKLEGTYNQ